MKILQIVPYFYPSSYGGTQAIVYQLGRHLSALGHEVTVVTTDALDRDKRVSPHNFHDVEWGIGYWETRIDRMRVRYYRNIFNRGAFAFRLFLPYALPGDIHRLVRSFHIVHIHEYRTIITALAAAACRRYSIPHVLSAHGGILRMSGRKGRKWLFDHLLGKTLLQGITAMVALTEQEQEQYLRFGLTSHPIEILPNGILWEDYANLPPRGTFRRQWGFGSRPIVLFLGRIHHIKGLDFLVRAFGNIKGRVPGVCLLIVGPDDGDKKRVKGIMRERGLVFTDRSSERNGQPSETADVVFLGLRTGVEKQSILRDSDVLVLPSRAESFPAVPFEALMAGAAPVVTESCGIASIFKEKEMGEVVPFGDEETLADVLIRLLSDPLKRQALVKHGLHYIKDNLSWNTVARKYSAFYTRLSQRERK